MYFERFLLVGIFAVLMPTNLVHSERKPSYLDYYDPVSMEWQLISIPATVSEEKHKHRKYSFVDEKKHLNKNKRNIDRHNKKRHNYSFYSIESTNGGPFFNFSKLEIYKKQKEGSIYVINANFDQLITLDNTFKISSVIYRGDNMDENGMEEVFRERGVGFCDYMSTAYKDFEFGTIMGHSNFPPPETCPWEKATYFVNNFEYDLVNFDFETGCYLIEFLLSKEDLIIEDMILWLEVKEVNNN